MREIKFRAWDIEAKKMISWSELNKLDADGILHLFDVLVNFEDYKVIPMQYTGLKDKNGKDIYEGDVLKNYLSHKYNNSKALWRVCFVEGGFSYFRILDGLKINRYQRPADFVCHKNWEVIGNIYENPELLNTQQRG